MTISLINAKDFGDLSALDGRALSGLSAVDGQSIAAGGPLPTDLSGLELWLPVSAISQADNSDIVTWPDQSGNGRDATGAGGVGAKPKYLIAGGPNGGPRVRLFNAGSSATFTLPNFLTAFTAGEAIVVLQINADPPADTGHSGPPLGGWGNGASLYPYFGDSKIYEGFGTTARKDATKDPDTNLTAWHVYNPRSQSGLYEWSINGAVSGNDYFSTATNSVGWGTAPRIADAVGVAQLFGYMVEVIMYSRVLDQATERGPVVYTYLNNTYGFSLPTS
jgi:hypothetical protein